MLFKKIISSEQGRAQRSEPIRSEPVKYDEGGCEESVGSDLIERTEGEGVKKIADWRGEHGRSCYAASAGTKFPISFKRHIRGLLSLCLTLLLSLPLSACRSGRTLTNESADGAVSNLHSQYFSSAYDGLVSASASTDEVFVSASAVQFAGYKDSAFLIPPYSGKLVVEINDNEPVFAELKPDFESYQIYSELDELGRVGVAEAVLGPETLPKGKRQSIRSVKPTGWHQNFYSFIEQNALYTRSHLIAFQLSGQSANPENLMTGTHMFNTIGMVPYEEMVGNYIRSSKNHVQYRVTPYFGYFDLNENNLLADGVQIEARSVEDGGKAISFNVFVYNVESGVDLDYATGFNRINALGRKMGHFIPKH